MKPFAMTGPPEFLEALKVASNCKFESVDREILLLLCGFWKRGISCREGEESYADNRREDIALLRVGMP